MYEDWNVWDIKNPYWRIVVIWAIVLFLVPPVLAIETIARLITASINELVYHEKGSMRGFFSHLRLVFSKKTWGPVWKSMVSLERIK